jgi:hypothetical protein
MAIIHDASFRAFDEFSTILGEFKLIFYHIFDTEPDQKLVRFFESSSYDEILLLFNIKKDKGFLAKTQITVEITPPPREFISRPLIELLGLGSWAKGTPYGSESDETKYLDLINESRTFAFGPSYSAE